MELKTFTNLARLKDMVMIMARFGFGDLIQRLDLPVKTIVHSISPASIQTRMCIIAFDWP